MEEWLHWIETFSPFVLMEDDAANPLLPPKIAKIWKLLEEVVNYHFRLKEDTMRPEKVAAASTALRGLATALQMVNHLYQCVTGTVVQTSIHL